jgi:hypothetical protein
MCYVIYLSTTSDEDLGLLPQDDYIISRPTEADPPAILALLSHPNQWVMLCRYGGCSCHFRHSSRGWLPGAKSGTGVEASLPYFSPVEDWSPEDDDDVDATARVYDLVSRVVAEGHSMDLIDVLEGVVREEIRTLDVSLGSISRESFRFFENYKFVFAP